MIRRSQQGQFVYQALPDKEETVYVSCSDIYAVLSNNRLHIILDRKYQNDREIQHQKEILMKKNSSERVTRLHLFLQQVVEATKDEDRCKFVGMQNPERILANQTHLYLHKIWFDNKRSHVKGNIDGLMHVSWCNQIFGTSFLIQSPFYIMIYLASFPLNSYHEHKIIAQLYYFSSLYPGRVRRDRVYIIGKDGKGMEYHVTEDKIQEMKRVIADVRKTKKIAPFVDFDNLPHIKYFPNMKSRDALWMPFKKQIAFSIGEITNVWGCDEKIRQKAFDMGIYSWKDPRFSPERMQITDPYRCNIIRSVLETNRQEAGCPGFEWIRGDTSFLSNESIHVETDIYVDFEYTKTHVYLIGIYHRGAYISFWADALDDKSEMDMMKRFDEWLSGHPDSRVWYWYADLSKWKSLSRKHGFRHSCLLDRWHDMCHLMKKGPITVYGAMDFSLKTIVNAFYQNQKIPFHYQDLEGCQNGVDSVDDAIIFYRHYRAKTRPSGYLEEIRQNLLDYNRMDCEAMYYILKEICQLEGRQAGSS